MFSPTTSGKTIQMKEYRSHKVRRDEVQIPRGDDDVQQQPLCACPGVLKCTGSSHSSQVTEFFLPSVKIA